MGRAAGGEQAVTLARREGVETERKYLLLAAPSEALLTRADRVLEIEQIYLRKQDSVKPRLRKLTENGRVTLVHTEKERISPMSQLETESEITAEEFAAALISRDPKRQALHKRRYIFELGGDTWELDEITHPASVWLLEIELASEMQHRPVPTMFGPVKEVTFSDGFSSRKIAGGSLDSFDYAQVNDGTR